MTVRYNYGGCQLVENIRHQGFHLAPRLQPSDDGNQTINLLGRITQFFTRSELQCCVGGCMLSKSKDRRVAAGLAFAGILLPGLHKFYLGQRRWGVCYLLLGWITPISVSKIASVAEGFWYLFQDHEDFDRSFNPAHSGQNFTPGAISSAAPMASVHLFADAIHQLEQLRQEGLISEYEFEQKRRQFIDRLG